MPKRNAPEFYWDEKRLRYRKRIKDESSGRWVSVYGKTKDECRAKARDKAAALAASAASMQKSKKPTTASPENENAAQDPSRGVTVSGSLADTTRAAYETGAASVTRCRGLPEAPLPALRNNIHDFTDNIKMLLGRKKPLRYTGTQGSQCPRFPVLATALCPV